MRTLLFCLFAVSCCGCGHVAGNYPVPTGGKLRSQREYRHEILAADGFKVVALGWFDSQKAIAEYRNDQERLRDAPRSIKRAFENNALTLMNRKLASEGEESSAFARLGFYIDPGVDIRLQVGALILTLQDASGHESAVGDRGCVVGFRDGSQTTIHDTSQAGVVLNCGVNDQALKREAPIVVWVRLDPEYNRRKMVGLALNRAEAADQ